MKHRPGISTFLSLFLNQIPNLCNRLNRSNLIIRIHDRNQNRIWSKHCGDLFDGHQPFAIRFKIRNFESFFLFQMNHRLQNSMMFNRSSDEMFALFLIGTRISKDRQVIGLCSPRREKNFVWSDMENICDRLTRIIQVIFDFFSKRMKAGWISKFFSKIRQHHLANTRVDGSGGRMIKIDVWNTHRSLKGNKKPLIIQGLHLAEIRRKALDLQDIFLNISLCKTSTLSQGIPGSRLGLNLQ